METFHVPWWVSLIYLQHIICFVDWGIDDCRILIFNMLSHETKWNLSLVLHGHIYSLIHLLSVEHCASLSHLLASSKKWVGSSDTFVFAINQQFPLTQLNNSGIIIQVINATSESSQIDEFNATSVLSTTTLALDLQNVSSIQCGTNSLRSEVIDFSMLNIQGKNIDSIVAYLYYFK